MTYDDGKVSKYAKFLLEGSIRPVAVLNVEGMVIDVNAPFSEKFTLNPLSNIKELLDENSREMWDELSEIAKKTDSISYNSVILHKSGNRLPVTIKLLYCDSMRNLVVLIEDSFSVKHKVETAYLNSFHMMDKLLILINPNGEVVDMNDVSMNFFRFPPQFFIGKNAKDLISLFSLSIEKYKQYMATALEEGYAETIKRYTLTKEDVRYYKIMTFYDIKTEMFLVKMSDYTEKVILEERLAHHDSLLSVGQLAASIAHEIRNPLTTLKGFTQLLKVSAENTTLRYLNVIDDEISRMEVILNEMLILSKPSTDNKSLISLKSVLTDMIFLIRPKAKLSGVSVECVDETTCKGLIHGNEVKLKQVILNLFKNSIEAMMSGGKLSITITQNFENQLVVTISDTGIGMSRPHLEQIFTPFYTTREEGTGLGLPFVMKTVNDHGATIQVESELGEGTTFVLTFPPETAKAKDLLSKREMSVLRGMAETC